MASIAVEREEPTASRLGTVLGVLGPYRALQRNRGLALLFGGQVVSALGDWLYITALVVLVYDLTRSVALTAALTATRLLPYVIGLPLGGVLADRFDRRTLMIGADLGRVACMIGMLAVSSRSTVWLAFPLVFLTTSLASIFRPALGAIVPAFAGDAEELTRANALMGQIDGVSVLLGPALGGVFVLLGVPHLAFAFNAATYAVSAITLARLRVPPRASETAGATGHVADAPVGWVAEITAGARFLFGARAATLGAVTLATAGLTAFNGASWTLLVVLAEQTWHMGGQGAGFLIATYGLGALLGGFAVGPLVRRLRSGGSFIASLGAAAGAIALLGLCPAGPLPFAVLLAFGSADMVNQVVGTTLIQAATPPALLGRVFGAFEATIVGAVVLGALAVAPLIGAFGPRAATVALALPGFVLALGTLPRLRALDHPAPPLPPTGS